MSTISYLTRIEFGEGADSAPAGIPRRARREAPADLPPTGAWWRRGWWQRSRRCWRTPAVFDGTPANPTEEAVLAAHAVYTGTGCDGIIGLGGGSALDLAKGVRLLTGHEGPLAQYTLVAGGLSRIHGRICPMIAIPTTSGTGSEVGRAAVIITAEGRKLGIISPHMLPSIALCDPELTYGLPPGLTAATGMDAISHCLETYMASAFNPPADAIAMDGLTRGWRSLRSRRADGSDKAARNDMMMCALEGAMAFQKGLGAVHALTHPLGAIRQLNLHHGTLNAVLMPAVLRFNREAIGKKWDGLDAFFGAAPDTAIAELNRDYRHALRACGHWRHGGHDEACLAGSAEGSLPRDQPRIATAADYLAIMRELRTLRTITLDEYGRTTMSDIAKYRSIFSLKGKKAIVTGGSRGIGKALAEGLAAHGADVAIVVQSTVDRAEAWPRTSAPQAAMPWSSRPMSRTRLTSSAWPMR